MMRGTLVAAALAALGVVAVVVTSRSHGSPRVASVFSERVFSERVFSERAPDSVRVRVQVLNGTTTRGLARRATMLLRDRGFDVVETGTVSDARDTTLVLDLSGHPDWARRVARVLGIARIAARPDSSRYLDIAVVLGATWRPPAEPLHP
jgi:hypothetical protein